MINGNTLIGLGYIPDSWFKKVIDIANEQGLSESELIHLANQEKPEIFEPRPSPISYAKNITADNELEQQNLNKVEEEMDKIMRVPTIIGGAIMPDACPVGDNHIPVGGIAVAKNAIHPAMHSADICCSVMATNFGFVKPEALLNAAHSVTHFGGGGRKDPIPLPISLEGEILMNKFFDDQSVQVAKSHLGTQGDGNHFLFVGTLRSTGETMMVTHHGSRGLGARLFKKGMKVAEGYRRNISPKTHKNNAWIPFDTDDGKAYWNALQIVRSWTRHNHRVIHMAAMFKSGADGRNSFWNEHNFVFKDGQDFYHAKGATPLDNKFVPDSTNGLRLIPLNMSQPILVVKGKRTKNNIGFAPHGAGRNTSRTRHIKSKAGKTFQEVFDEETKGIDARFFSGNIDISELPSAYKNAHNVQRQMRHFGLGDVVDYIDPYGCIMAGDWMKDAPWKRKKEINK